MFKLVHKRLLILSSIALLILPNSFFAGLISRTVGLFKKFSLWSFKVIKHLFLLLMSILTVNVHLNRIVLVHLNINSLRNKFDILTDQITGNVDIMVISETKFDDSFPESQFKISGYSSPFRLDQDQNGGGIMVFVREDITAKLLSFEDKPIEVLFTELNFRKNKWHGFLAVHIILTKTTSQTIYNG